MMNRRHLLILPILSGLIFVVVNRLSARTPDRLDDQGIRPDVARAIDERFPDSRRMRLAARQSARAVQKAIDHPENAWAIVEEVHKATSCIYAAGAKENMDHDQSGHVPVLIEGMVVNSWARSRAYWKYNANLSGGVFQVAEGDFANCEFDAEKE